MFIKAHDVRGLAALSMLLLSACSSVASVKEVTSDQAGYMTKKFSPKSLSANIEKKIPPTVDSTNFGQLKITVEASNEQSDGKKQSYKNVMTLTDMGNGQVERLIEQISNDISYNLVYALTYKGIVGLRWQAVPLLGTRTTPLYEIRDVTRFDAIPSKANNEFVVEYTMGREDQMAGGIATQLACKSTRIFDAKELNEKLPGLATEFNCQQLYNKAVQNHSKWVMLQKYGFAIMTEEITSTQKTCFRVIDFNG